MPAAVGVFIFLFTLLISEPTGLSEGLYVSVMETFFVTLAFSHVLVGIQSFLYAMAMEFYVNPKFK